MIFSINPSDIEGDPLSFYWDLDNDGSWDISDSQYSTASFTWNDDYSGSVIVGISDGFPLVKIAIPVTITNVAPIVDAGSDQTINEGDSVVFSGTFTDAGSADMHTIEWDFGDGNTEPGLLKPVHTYDDDGGYTVTLTVTDDDGAVTSDTLTVTVNNLAPNINTIIPDAALIQNGTSIGTHNRREPHLIEFLISSQR